MEAFVEENNDRLAHSVYNADGTEQTYGIADIDTLFPEYKNINGDGAPGFIKNQPDAWVEAVMNGIHRTPFARIKMMYADLREDDAE